VDEARARELLGAERARIEGELRHARERPDAELIEDQHLADQASDLLQEEIDEGQLDRLRRELQALERAEARLTEGTYGRSVESGDPIPDERLEAYPLAERTAAEQARYDRAFGRAR
jgi:DnaK suppressor protein